MLTFPEKNLSGRLARQGRKRETDLRLAVLYSTCPMSWFVTKTADVVAGSVIYVVMHEEIDQYPGRCTKRIEIVTIRMSLNGSDYCFPFIS